MKTSFRVSIRKGEGEVTVVSVLRDLLKVCERSRQQIHGDMNRLEGRFVKHLVRSWWRHYLRSPHLTPAFLDSDSVGLMNLLFENQLPIGRLITEYETIISQLPSRRDVKEPAAIRYLDALTKNVTPIGAGLDLDSPFPCHPATLMRAVALAIDDAQGSRLALAFQAEAAKHRGSKKSKSPASVKAGDLFLSRTPGVSSFCAYPAYNLAQSEDDAGQLPTVRRLTQKPNLAMKMRVGSQASETLNCLSDRRRTSSSLRVGFACLGSMISSAKPNFTIQDRQRVYAKCGLPDEVFAESRRAVGLGQFFGVEYATQSVLVNILEASQAVGTDVLIYPELAMSAATEAEIVRRFNRPDSVLQLLVAGSRHILNRTSRVNRLQAFARPPGSGNPRGKPVFVHDKIGTFGFLDSRDSCYYVEDVSRPRSITLTSVDELPLGMLICKDVLQTSVLNAITSLGIRRLIVSAMSEKTDDFAIHLSELAARCNTISFFSCFSGEGEITAGVFGPARGATAILLRNGSMTSPNYAMRSLSRENATPVTQPSLAWIDLPLGPPEGEGADSRFSSNKWFEVLPVETT